MPTGLWMAELDTGKWLLRSFSETRAAAVAIVCEALRRHAQQSEWTDPIGQAPDERIVDYFGVNVTGPVTAGSCWRDGEKF